MNSFRLTFVFLMLSASIAVGQTDGYENLYNGKDLTGWSYLPTTKAQKKSRANWQRNPKAPPWPIVETKVNFDGKANSDDGRFVAEGEVLVVSVPQEGRKIQMLYSDVEVKGDFELRLEFRAAENADSGVFIRGRQLQCRDYQNAGPYKKLKKFKPGDWNELVVIVSGKTARCTCNGEVLEEKFKVPAEGPIGVEGDRGKLEYRNIRIKRSSNNLLKPTGDVDAWTIQQIEKGKGEIRADGDSIFFDVTQAGDKNWHVQTFQSGFKLEEGAEYRVSFEIKANVDDAAINVRASTNEKDWHRIGLDEKLTLTTGFERHEFIFKASDVHPNNNRVGFGLGDNVMKVTVRDFSLTFVGK